MRIQMLRNLAVKPGTPEKAKRFEGQEYDVSSKEGTALIRQGLAVDVNRPAPVAESEEEDEEEGDGLDGLKFMQLKEIAEAEGLTLAAKSKVDAVAEIRAARQAAAGGAGDDTGAGAGDAGE